MKKLWTLGLVSLGMALVLSCGSDKVKVGTDAANDIGETSSGDAVDGRAGLETVEPQDGRGDGSGSDACVPQCVFGGGYVKECGDDWCGGSCGSCPDGYECVEAGYGATSCFSQDECPVMCAERNLQCGPFSPFWEGDDSIICECGDCPGEAVCLGYGDGESYCCTPDCDGKECGDDGCGGTCGECPQGQECVADTCKVGECVPNCVVDEGGEEYLSECETPDGCGGTCGPCEPDEVCALADYAEIGICFNPDESCPGMCEFEEAECGAVWAGFVWPDCECGECDNEQETCVNNKCVCQPDCDGKKCGDDGCGGNCGVCLNYCGQEPDDPIPDAGLCIDGQCKPAYVYAIEECDGVDNDCDAQIDEGYPDSDNDGLADCIDLDDDNDGSLDEQDCEPLNKNVYPGAPEQCDCVDNNCNGVVDEGYPDSDGDGNSDCCDPGDDDGDGVWDGTDNCLDIANPGQEDNDWDDMGDACDPDDDNDLYLDDEDCDPLDPLVNPGADELCDEVDNNCDGQVDEGCPCVPDCEDKECGDDGCGGSCGDCPKCSFCDDGVCSFLCDCDCDNKGCGDDGCGGSCGTCADGQECNEQGKCE